MSFTHIQCTLEPLWELNKATGEKLYIKGSFCDCDNLTKIMKEISRTGIGEAKFDPENECCLLIKTDDVEFSDEKNHGKGNKYPYAKLISNFEYSGKMDTIAMIEKANRAASKNKNKMQG